MIECAWKKEGKILTNVDGQVYPCCYLVNMNFQSDFIGNKDGQLLMNKYNEAKDELNVFKQPMSKIMNHPWWEELENSWNDSDKTLRQCTRWCTVKENKDA